MIGFDGDGGRLARRSSLTGDESWCACRGRAGPITERPEVRREIVALYDEACRRLGVEPRPHA